MSSRTPARAELDGDRLLPAGRLAELFDLDHEVVGSEHVGVARGRAQVDPGRDPARPRDVLGHLLRHQLATEAGLGALRDVDLDAVGRAHGVHRPAEAPAEALGDHSLCSRAHLGDEAALARVVADVGERRRLRERDLRRLGQGAVAHRRDHHGHRQVDRLRAEAAAEGGCERDLRHDVRVGVDLGEVSPESDVGDVRERPSGAVAANPVAADLRLDRDVLLHLVVPVVGPLGPDEEGNDAHARLRPGVVEVLARVDDLLQGAGERNLVAIEEGEDVVGLVRLEVGLHRVVSERHDLAADVDRAAVDVLPDLLARVAADHEPPAVHHVPGHEAGAARAAERALLHHLTGPGADVAVHDHVRPADRYARDCPRVAPDHDRAAEHVVGEAPADVAVDLEARPVGEPGAEVPCRPPHTDRDRARQADTDVVAGVRVDHLDVLVCLPVLEQEPVRVGDRGLREVDCRHRSLVLRPGSHSRPGQLQSGAGLRPQSHRYVQISGLPASLPGLLFACQVHQGTPGTKH